jgi:cysteinyl-tRNA synthetase
VRLFVCGPTVYDAAHLGHAKTALNFDFIARYLRSRGLAVTYVQNITDIDDKILGRAAREGVSWRIVADRSTAMYFEDMRALGVTSVTKYAKATDYIPAMISQIERLLRTGHAYITTDGVSYDVSTFPGYARLSGRTEAADCEALSRVDDSAVKRNQKDFALWKFRKPGEPFWEAPWGAGRPGWHIEDTAITETEFGPTYEMHGGALDLVFPHHEAEIAQMESISGLSPMVRYWLHTGFVTVGGQKMSKSLGNFVSLRDLLTRYGCRVVRFLILRAHYRAPINFDRRLLEQSASGLRRLEEFASTVDSMHDDQRLEPAVAATRRKIQAHLADDFNTPRAIGALFEFVREANASARPGQRTAELLSDLNSLFGFLPSSLLLDRELLDLIQRREQYRTARNYAGADALREQVLAKGVQLYDTPEGVRWRRISSPSDHL